MSRPRTTTFTSREVVLRDALRTIVDNWGALPVSAAQRASLDDGWTLHVGTSRERVVKPLHIVQAYLDACEPCPPPPPPPPPMTPVVPGAPLADGCRSSGMGFVGVRYFRPLHTGRQTSIGPSLQGMPRSVRHTVCAGLFRDFDLVNAHPTLLSQYCARHAIPSPTIDRYVLERDAMLASLGVPRDQGKGVVLCVLYGGWAEAAKVPGGPPAWLREMRRELQRVASSMLSSDDHRATVAAARLRVDRKVGLRQASDPGQRSAWGNLEGSVVSCIMQEVEDSVLLAAVARLDELGVSTSGLVLVYDGVMVPCSALESSGTDAGPDLMLDLGAAVERATGYTVTFVEKPMDEALDLSGLSPLSADPVWQATASAAVAAVASREDSVAGITVSRRCPYGSATRRQYARLPSASAVSALVGAEGAHEGADVTEVLGHDEPVRVFFRLQFPVAHAHSAATVIAQFMEAGVNPVIGRGVVSAVSVAHGDVTTSVRVVLHAQTASLVDCYQICARVERRVLALRWRFPALRMHSYGTTPLDMSVYSGGSHMPVLGSVDPAATRPLVPHATSSTDPVAHMIRGGCDSRLGDRFLSASDMGGGRPPRELVGLRSVARAVMRPFTSAERATYAGWLNAWEVVPEVFGGHALEVTSVTERDGLARVELAPDTPCPFNGVRHLHHSRRASDLHEPEESPVSACSTITLTVDDSGPELVARATCSQPCCRGREVLMRGSGSSHADALDRVCTGTLHTQERGVEWGQRYDEPDMRPLPGGHGLLVVMAQMGLGKTKAVVEHLRATCTEDTSVLAISHSVALSTGTNRALCEGTGLEFTLYSDTPSGTNLAQPRVTVCLDSLGRCALSSYDVVVVDEVSSVLTHFNSKHMTRSDLVSHKLERVLASAGRIVLVDAVCDSTLVKLAIDRLQTLRGERAFWVRNDHVRASNRRMHLRIDSSPFVKTTVTTGRYRALDTLFKRLDRGENVIFVSNIRAAVVAASEAFQRKFPGKAYRAYYGDGPYTLKSASVEWPGQMMVAISPAVTAGVSFEAKHFHSLVAYVDGGPYSPGVETVLQMLWRVRDLSGGEMDVFYHPASESFSDGPQTARGVGELLCGSHALTRRYLDDMHVHFEATRTLAEDGGAPFDCTRLSWDVLVGSLVAKHRSLARGAELLATTVREDYGVAVTVEVVGNCEDGELEGTGLSLKTVCECLETARANDADVPYEELETALMDPGPQQDAARLLKRQGKASAAQIASLAMADTVDVWEMHSPLYAGKAFYLEHVVGGRGVWMRLVGLARRLGGKTSADLRAEFSRVVSELLAGDDPNLELQKRTKSWLKTCIHAQELAEAVLTTAEAASVAKPGLGQAEVQCAHLCEAVESVRARYTPKERAELSKLLFSKTGERDALKWFAKAMETAFHLEVKRVSRERGRPGYQRVVVSSLRAWKLVDLYRPRMFESLRGVAFDFAGLAVA